MGLIDNIKNDAKKSGQSRGKFFYVRENEKVRVRFLQEMDDGLEVSFHDNYSAGINPVPCQEQYNRDCPYCNEEGIRTRSQYVWSVWNYEAKEVQLFMFPVNNCSPVPALLAMYETYGTITDRDYVVSVSGKQQNKTYSVIPMDKVKFRNEKAKPFSEKATWKMIDKAYPYEDVDMDSEYEDDEDETPKKRQKKTGGKKKDPEPKYDDDYDDDFDDDDESEEELDYSTMDPKELYKLCKSRKIDVQPRKTQKYYIRQLEEYDEAHSDWEDDDEDDWEDEE